MDNVGDWIGNGDGRRKVSNSQDERVEFEWRLKSSASHPITPQLKKTQQASTCTPRDPAMITINVLYFELNDATRKDSLALVAFSFSPCQRSGQR